jgi:Sulfatase-modifying factor enzyme 1
LVLRHHRNVWAPIRVPHLGQRSYDRTTKAEHMTAFDQTISPPSPCETGAVHIWALVERLSGPDWRLVVTGERDGRATGEVAHEILLKTWPTLKRWLEDEREFLVWRGELDVRRKEYDEAGKEGSRRRRQALLMGLPLDTATKWLAARRADIEPADCAFIEASVRADRAAARNRAWLQRAVGVLLLCVIGGLLAQMYEGELRAQWYWATAFLGRGYTETALRNLRPKDRFTDCVDTPSDDQHRHRIRRYCPDMVVVPPDKFIMGEKERRHEVTIAGPFAVSRFAVTFDQWDACVAGGGCDNYRPNDAGWARGRRPVIDVSWQDAQNYVDWLNRMTGQKSYRLLSEAEFEYAGRAGSTTTYPWGDDIGENNANCDGCKSEWDNKRPLRSALSQPTPSAFSTCTAMSGNGSRTVGTRITRRHRRTARRGKRLAPATIVAGWCTAGPGTTFWSTCVRPNASGASPTPGATVWVPGRPDARPVNLYCFAPGRVFGAMSLITDKSQAHGSRRRGSLPVPDLVDADNREISQSCAFCFASRPSWG